MIRKEASIKESGKATGCIITNLQYTSSQLKEKPKAKELAVLIEV